VLFCNVKSDGCTTPAANRNDLLFDANTHWTMPGAKDFLTLAFMQDLIGKYSKGGEHWSHC
jgi:hypothetical protein